jgi:hypothetical protein
MPRRQRTLTPAAPILGRALIASAARYKGNEAPTTWHADSKKWQAEAYRHYRICGEARFSAQFFGHALAKSVLYVTDGPDSKNRVTEGLPVERMAELFNGAGGQSALLSAAGVHLTVAGEFYIIGRRGPAGEDLWEVRSVQEITCTGRGKDAIWQINGSGTQQRITLTSEDTVIRVWIPDPQDSICADSPFRSLLPILEEIEWLTKYVFAQASARVSGAGLLIMPEEMDMPSEPGATGSPEQIEGDTTKAGVLMRIMANVLGAAIQDPGSVAAKIPSVMTAPGEFIDKIKWQTFWSELDENAQKLRQEAIQRFALGMDLPPERVLGMSTGVNSGGGNSTGANHWTAWQVDEDTIKMHIEPMLDVLAAALTVYYLRPTLEDPADAMVTVCYDTSQLRLRPDRSQEAMELYDRGLVSPKVVLRENGFDPEDDAMSPDERIEWLTVKMASGSATPQMVAQAAAILGVEVDVPTDAPNLMPNEARPVPSLEDHPRNDIPDSEYQLVAAYDALCYRALERAGNKIRSVVRNAGGEVPTCSSFEVHTFIPSPENSVKRLLADAWSCAPQVLEPYDIDVEQMVSVLNGYVTSLITTGNPHNRASLIKWLEAKKEAA